jgi:tetratricopeptide (TPR) repeat protein/predicted Ser/Thr protein kinase
MAEGYSDRVEILFYLVADRPPGEQRALLEAACPDDPGLRAAVEKLLADDARLGAQGSTSFLDSPLVRPTQFRTTVAMPPPAVLPARVGRYRILRLLGEGGMGVVYEAEQDHPRRTVALKVIRPGLVSPRLLKRFAQETQILGRLHHPGIAPIYDAGVAEDGQPFFALELIHGEPLDEYARLGSLTLPTRLELLARVCDAVQHAHEQGVIHRDLKPGNILVDQTGQPRVLDFGVARELDDDLRSSADCTRTGQLLGTLSYMSPEQVATDPAGLDCRSDVYTLGVILFELLAGRLPYSLEHLSLPEVARVIREQEPARLGALDARYRGDVETIVARALEKDPTRRYPSAAELAADIRRHLRHEPIRARPPSPLYQLGKFARRHKALVATTTVFLSLLLGGGAVTAWQAVQLARADAKRAVQQARRSQDVHDALAQAAMLREQARSTAGAGGQWAKAREVARRAEALVESGQVEPGLAEQVAALLRELDEEQADHQLVARLEEARLLQTEIEGKEGRFTVEKALPAIRDAFADHGLRPGSTEPAEAAALLRRRPAAVLGPMVAALDHWLTLARLEKAPEADWLTRVLATADPDPWRQRFRVAVGRPALEKLAREVEVAAQPPQALFLLDRALQASGSPESAVEMLQRAQEAYPGDFWINHNLGISLAFGKPPQLDDAIRFLTAAVALRPASPGARLNLGVILEMKGRRVEAAATIRKVIALKPDCALAHRNLGLVLLQQGDLAGAAGSLHRVTDLVPNNALAHHQLGIILRKQGDLSGAVASYRRANELDPKSAERHYNLGRLLAEQEDLPGAIASYRQALSLDPKYTLAHNNLGTVLWRQGDPHAAVACFRRCLQIDPKSAEAHVNLGNALLSQGNFRGALEEFQTGHGLGVQLAALWVKRCKHLLELEERLPAILKGEDRTASAAERLDLAEVCHLKRLHANAVQLFTEALAADAKRAGDLRGLHRYRAACSAALLGCGQGKEAERARLRQQAFAWLRADLTLWARHRDQYRPLMQAVLGTWQVNPALAGVRDARALAALPAAEREGWQQLWADVAATLAKARDRKKPPDVGGERKSR